MAQIHNTDLFKELKDGGKIQQLHDVIPNQLAEKVVPVMEVNPKFFRRVNVVISSLSAGTIYTTPTDKDFYLTFAHMSAQTVTAGAATCTLAITPFEINAATIILNINLQPTALIDTCHDVTTASFTPPILLKRGTVITSAATAGVNKRFVIAGYTVDNINA